ncbi:MAG: nitrous oxide reductase accessory protein NosL [Bacteroidetes bacterium]|nr:nitrous oxide reductase accessory protein NosL [Bacteroidota bacterium]MCB0845263.1 nitrous oxide reductase accessory protein NosL [Bacteroidota bacterium]MCB0855043.1 nitrous oxide reductase accessory protein NosL [Bacteroidota bacterium]
MLRYKLLICALILLIGCQVSPRKIEYGHDACAFCKMTIIDQRHAAQLVTEKGRNYVFDAIECMIRYQKETPQTYRFQLVSDYLSPGTLIQVEEATFMISNDIPSPMGAFLSAFADTDQLYGLPEAEDGKIYKWTELKQAIVSK